MENQPPNDEKLAARAQDHPLFCPICGVEQEEDYLSAFFSSEAPACPGDLILCCCCYTKLEFNTNMSLEVSETEIAGFHTQETLEIARNIYERTKRNENQERQVIEKKMREILQEAIKESGQ